MPLSITLLSLSLPLILPLLLSLSLFPAMSLRSQVDFFVTVIIIVTSTVTVLSSSRHSQCHYQCNYHYPCHGRYRCHCHYSGHYDEHYQSLACINYVAIPLHVFANVDATIMITSRHCHCPYLCMLVLAYSNLQSIDTVTFNVVVRVQVTERRCQHKTFFPITIVVISCFVVFPQKLH